MATDDTTHLKMSLRESGAVLGREAANKIQHLEALLTDAKLDLSSVLQSMETIQFHLQQAQDDVSCTRSYTALIDCLESAASRIRKGLGDGHV